MVSDSDTPHHDRGGIGTISAGIARTMGAFFFSYSPRLNTLVSSSHNEEQVLGSPLHTIMRDGNLFLRYVHPDDRFSLLSSLEAALRGEGPLLRSYRWVRPDRHELRTLHCRAALSNEGTEPLFEGCIIDISELEGLQAGKPNLETIAASLPDAVVVLDRDGRISSSNLCEQTESTATTEAKLWFDFGDPEFRFSAARTGVLLSDCFADRRIAETIDFTCREAIESGAAPPPSLVRSGDNMAELHVHPVPLGSNEPGLLLLARDVTKQQALQTRLQRLERAEGLRRLAIALAHNFNNSLQAILGQAITIRDNSTQPALVQRASQAITEAAVKASKLTQQFFELDEPDATTKSTVDLNLATMAALKEVEGIFGPELDLHTTFGNPPLLVTSRALLDDCLAAVLRAMCRAANDTSCLTITTAGSRSSPVVDRNSAEFRCVLEGATGAVLHPAQLEGDTDWKRAVRIIGELKGRAVIETPSPHQIRISLFVPVAQRKPAQIGSARAFEPEQPEILLVDDDPFVLESTHALLIENGFHCITAPHYRDALHLAQVFGASLRVALVDALMPDMDGPALVEELRAICPHLRILGFTGAARETANRLRDRGVTRILEKPVPPQELLAAIGEFFDVAAPARTARG